MLFVSPTSSCIIPCITCWVSLGLQKRKFVCPLVSFPDLRVLKSWFYIDMRILSHSQTPSGGKVNQLALANVYSRGVGAKESKKNTTSIQKLVEFTIEILENNQLRPRPPPSEAPVQESAPSHQGFCYPDNILENNPNNLGPSDCKGPHTTSLPSDLPKWGGKPGVQQQARCMLKPRLKPGTWLQSQLTTEFPLL